MYFLLVVCLLSRQTAALEAVQQDVQVKLGENVTLQCQISKHETISVLIWSRPDLNTDGYVYFYRNRRSYENYQHPSFHGRVKLRNPEMKDGDVSVILENVTFNNIGIYECHVAVRNSGRSKRAHIEISHFINLTVTDETHEHVLEKQVMEEEAADGNMHDAEKAEAATLQIIVAALVAALVAVLVAVAIIGAVLHWRANRNKRQHPDTPPNEEQTLKCDDAVLDM